MNKGGLKLTCTTVIFNAFLASFTDDRHAIARNKIMIVDRETVITGSYNFTKAAEEKTAENLLIIRNEDLAKIYMEECSCRYKEFCSYQ